MCAWLSPLCNEGQGTALRSCKRSAGIHAEVWREKADLGLTHPDTKNAGSNHHNEPQLVRQQPACIEISQCRRIGRHSGAATTTAGKCCPSKRSPLECCVLQAAMCMPQYHTGFSGAINGKSGSFPRHGQNGATSKHASVVMPPISRLLWLSPWIDLGSFAQVA